MIIQIDKLYLDRYADIRDFRRKEALKKKHPIVFEYGGKRMTIPYTEIKRRALRINKQKFQSKWYPDQFYTLIQYLWREDKKLTKAEEMELFSKQCL